MKHLLKPLGHCLTTAVITSAMLRVYSLPAVEAATPDTTANAQSAAEGTAAPGEATSLSASDLGSTPTVTPPQAISPVEAAAPPVASEVPEVPESGASPSLPTPAAPAQSSVAPAEETPAAAPQVVESTQAEQSSKPEAANSNAAGRSGLDDPKPASSTPEQKARASEQTIAGMRQVLEKKLAVIVEQDKATRNAQWQQNLTNSALQYAWLGKFERARQIAMHPALPLNVQTELLGKITALEQAFQIAQQSNQARMQPQQTPAISQGRSIPSGYPVVNLPSVASGYAGTVVNQCPALDRSTVRFTTAKTQLSSKSTSAKTGIPAFVPALGQNLAAQLAQLNQTPSARAPLAQTTQFQRQPVVSPQLFAGVVADSLQLQPQPQIRKPLPQVAKLVQQHTAAPVVQPSITHPQRFQSQPIPTGVATSPASTTSPANSPTAKAPTNLNLDQIVGSTLNFALGQIGIPISQLISDPLNLAWNWWATPDQSATAVSSPTQSPIAAATAEDTASSPTVAETGLSAPLLQTLEQDFTSIWQPPRDGRKLSIPNLLVSKAASKTATVAKPAVYDPSALIAMGCAGAQLAQYKSGYTVDPATSKKLGWVNLMFPLPIPSAITSAFGWRIHPISGDLRFHNGLDIGAPMGTPVLAALAGRVVAADYMGGYGLAVIVENGAKYQRNFYTHLSGIAVQPGMQVKQGAVLGWVGSTGNSTGPHLHFESQVQTQSGWTAIDPVASAAVSVASGK